MPIRYYKSHVFPVMAGIIFIALFHYWLVASGMVPVVEAGVARSMTDSDGYTRQLRF